MAGRSWRGERVGMAGAVPRVPLCGDAAVKYTKRRVHLEMLEPRAVRALYIRTWQLTLRPKVYPVHPNKIGDFTVCFALISPVCVVTL